MHKADISIWQHEHNFCGDTSSAEKRTRRVVALTGGMMLVEIVAGHGFLQIGLNASLHRHALGQVAWFIHVAPAGNGNVVGQQLQRNHRQQRR